MSSTERRQFTSGRKKADHYTLNYQLVQLKRKLRRTTYPIFPHQVACIDVDGVVADFPTALAEFAWNKLKIDLPLPPTKYDWWKDYTDIDLMYKVKKEHDFWLRVPPLPLTLQDRITIHDLIAHRYTLFTTTRFRTDGPTSVTQQTEQWLRAQGFKAAVLCVDRVDVLPHLFWVRGALNDMFDDATRLRIAGAYDVFLLDRPYNQGNIELYDVKRTTSIADFRKQLNESKSHKAIKVRRRKPNPFEMQIAMSRLKVLR